MQVTPTELPDVLDDRAARVRRRRAASSSRAGTARAFAAAGIAAEFVQDNHSRSRRGVLRGLHYQIEHAQGKLVRVVAGEVFDVAVDLRRGSPTFGRCMGRALSAANKRMLWVPPGFAHGFLVLSEDAEFLYKTTDYWYPEHERTLLWNDPALGIAWPLAGRARARGQGRRRAPARRRRHLRVAGRGRACADRRSS